MDRLVQIQRSLDTLTTMFSFTSILVDREKTFYRWQWNKFLEEKAELEEWDEN